MKMTMRRVARKLAATVHEMNEAQRLVLARRTSTEQYLAHRDAAPDTYQEFLTRTSGLLMHEPSARRRIRRAQAGT